MRLIVAAVATGISLISTAFAAFLGMSPVRSAAACPTFTSRYWLGVMAWSCLNAFAKFWELEKPQDRAISVTLSRG
jgi:hypothetical protein